MKKLCAVILCVLLALTPVLSVAESALITVRWDADEAGTAAWLRAAGYTDASVAKLAPACADLMNALGVQMTVDGDDLRGDMTLTLDNWDAMSFSYDMSGSDMLFWFSLMPDVVMKMSIDAQQDSPDAMAMTELLFPTVLQWAMQLPVVTENGYFVAETYTCTERIIIDITDHDLAVLLDDVAAVLEQNGIDDWKTNFDYLKLLLENGRDQGTAHIVVGMEQGSVKGISVTLLAAGKEFLTLSMTADSENFSAVMHWAENDGDYTAVAEAHASDILMTYSINVTRTVYENDGNGVKSSEEWLGKLSGEVFVEDMLDMTAVLTLADGTVLGSETILVNMEDIWILATNVFSGKEQTTAWTCTLTYSQCDSLPPMNTEGKTVLTEDEMLSFDAVDESEVMAWGFSFVSHLPRSVLQLITGQ